MIGDLTFKEGTCEVKLLHILDGGCGHERSPTRDDLDEAFTLQLFECFAHRDEADVQVLGELCLIDARACRDHSGQNSVADALLDDASNSLFGIFNRLNHTCGHSFCVWWLHL